MTYKKNTGAMKLAIMQTESSVKEHHIICHQTAFTAPIVVLVTLGQLQG